MLYYTQALNHHLLKEIISHLTRWVHTYENLFAHTTAVIRLGYIFLNIGLHFFKLKLPVLQMCF